MMHSPDQGATWENQGGAPAGASYQLRGIWGTGPERAFAVGAHGALLEFTREEG